MFGEACCACCPTGRRGDVAPGGGRTRPSWCRRRLPTSGQSPGTRRPASQALHPAGRAGCVPSPTSCRRRSSHRRSTAQTTGDISADIAAPCMLWPSGGGRTDACVTGQTGAPPQRRPWDDNRHQAASQGDRPRDAQAAFPLIDELQRHAAAADSKNGSYTSPAVVSANIASCSGRRCVPSSPAQFI